MVVGELDQPAVGEAFEVARRVLGRRVGRRHGQRLGHKAVDDVRDVGVHPHRPQTRAPPPELVTVAEHVVLQVGLQLLLPQPVLVHRQVGGLHFRHGAAALHGLRIVRCQLGHQHAQRLASSDGFLQFPGRGRGSGRTGRRPRRAERSLEEHDDQIGLADGAYLVDRGLRVGRLHHDGQEPVVVGERLEREAFAELLLQMVDQHVDDHLPFRPRVVRPTHKDPYHPRATRHACLPSFVGH